MGCSCRPSPPSPREVRWWADRCNSTIRYPEAFLTTAEKHALLEAEGTPWPTCDCHGEPCRWQSQPERPGGGRFGCRVRDRELKRRRRDARRGAVCIHCGSELETETLCADCAAKHRAISARHDDSSQRRLAKQLAGMAIRRRRRECEGFRPTGVGLAAFAAWKATGE